MAKNKYLLLALTKSKAKLRKAILTNSGADLIKTICEIAYNIIKGNYPIDSKVHKKLRKYKKSLRCLSCPKKPLHIKKKLIIQQGGFIPSLIATIIGGLLSQAL